MKKKHKALKKGYVLAIENRAIIFDVHYFLGGGFKDFLFSPLLGDMIQFD